MANLEQLRELPPELLAVAGGLGLLLIGLLAWARGRAQARRELRALHGQLAEIAGQLRQQAETAAVRDAHISRMLGERLDAVSMRLGQGLQEQAERTGQHLARLAAQLALIDEAQERIAELSGHVLGLQQVLADKQARGAFGQARLEAIIRDALPAELFAFQDTLSNGTRPDCTIRLPGSQVKLVIDAKFPLEAFEALRQAGDAAARQQALRQARRDVRAHIAAIAGKYLLPGETHDVAIMFVPAESVYAMLHEELPELVAEAHRQRVILAAPGVLMLLVQTLMSLWRDERMREQAGLIRRQVRLLLDDAERLLERARQAQRHAGRMTEELDRLLVAAERFSRRARRLDFPEPEAKPQENGNGSATD